MQQRTIYSNDQETRNATPAGMVTVAAFGMRYQVPAGRSVAETLTELNLVPAAHQAIRVNAEEVRDLVGKTLKEADTLTLTNIVRGGVA